MNLIVMLEHSLNLGVLENYINRVKVCDNNKLVSLKKCVQTDTADNMLISLCVKLTKPAHSQLADFLM
jgi:hypothetical protein